VTGRRLFYYCFLFTFLNFARVFAQTITTSVDTDQVELGDPVNLNVTITGKGASLPDPALPDLSDFEVYSSGRNSSFSMINGAFLSSLELNYTLIPKKAGKLVIGPLTIKVKGAAVSSNPIEITVKQPGAIDKSPPSGQRRAAGTSQKQQNDFFIEQAVDKRNPYVGEQVTLSFKFYQAVNLWGQPTLEWPKYSGVTIEDLPPNSRSRKHVDGKLYQVTEIKRALFPLSSGDVFIESPKLTISADDPGGLMDPFSLFDRNSARRGKPIVLTTDPIKLQVRPLPDRGIPESFAGGVGKYNVIAIVDKDSVGVDEPITLKVVLSGTGDLKSLPQIKMPEFSDFRVYESGKNESISQQGGKIAGSRTFELALIPKTSGAFAIPALEYSFFNADRGRYETVRTRPIEILATGEGLTDVGGAPKNIIETSRHSFGYIITDFPAPRSSIDLFGSAWFWLLQGVPVIGVLGAVVFRSHYRKLLGDRSYARRVTASKRSRAIFKSALAKKGGGDIGGFCGDLNDAVVGYVADRLDLPKSALTLDDLRGIEIIGADIKEELIGFLEGCQRARFAPGLIDKPGADSLLERASRLISLLEKEL